MAKQNAATLRRIKKHFANESAKTDLQRHLQNNEAEYLISAFVEHARLNGPWQTAEVARLMNLLMTAPKKKGRPSDARRNVDIVRRFLCLQAIETRRAELTKEHMRKYPGAPGEEYAPISDRKLHERIAKDCNMTFDHVRKIVRETLKKMGKSGTKSALLLERMWRG